MKDILERGMTKISIVCAIFNGRTLILSSGVFLAKIFKNCVLPLLVLCILYRITYVHYACANCERVAKD